MMSNDTQYSFEIRMNDGAIWGGKPSNSLLVAITEFSKHIDYDYHAEYEPDNVYLLLRFGDSVRKTPIDTTSAIKLALICKMMSVLNVGQTIDPKNLDKSNSQYRRIIEDLDVFNYMFKFEITDVNALSTSVDEIKSDYKEICKYWMGIKRWNTYKMIWLFDDSIDPLIEKMKYGDAIEIIDLNESSKYLDHKIDSY